MRIHATTHAYTRGFSGVDPQYEDTKVALPAYPNSIDKCFPLGRRKQRMKKKTKRTINSEAYNGTSGCIHSSQAWANVRALITFEDHSEPVEPSCCYRQPVHLP